MWSRQGLDGAAAEVCEQLRRSGVRPALIPFGGSSVLGARGYARCGEELRRQLPDLRTAVVALGSGGTMAGLVVSLGAAAVLGVDVGALPEPAPAVSEFAGLPSPEGLRVRRDQIGSGYATLTAPTADALVLAARTAGLVLDPTYTGRAMAGLIATVRDGDIRPGERTVFVHTGGLPGLFGHAEAVAYAEGQVVRYGS